MSPTAEPPSPSEDAPTIASADAHTIDSRPTATSGEPVPATIGNYRIVGKLGAGGMGIVFEAEQEHPRRRVALKVIRGGGFLDEQSVRLFQREVDTLARLKHPNIGAIYDAGRTDAGQHFFAMELVRGLTLDGYLDARRRPVDADELRFRLRLFLLLCGAVSYAHQRGVIHRDLKPSNIVVAEHVATDASTSGASASSVRSALPDLKVLDFGLARITDADVEAMTVMSEVGAIKGTLPYMSPEQARGDTDRIDVRSDVYALGVILYEMLTAKRPYETQRHSIVEAVRVICEQPPASLRASWSGARAPDHDVQTIVSKALEKDSDRRYASVAALAEDVERFLDARPILARAPSTMYQLRTFARRNRTLVAGAAATVVALVLGIVATTTFGVREAAQRRAAEQAQRDTQAMVEFQAGMLGDIDAQQMGRRLEADLSSRLAQARREAGAPDRDVDASIAAFGAQMSQVNTTDAALRVIDENILERAIATLAKQFADRPLIRAQMLGSIGQTYMKLGLYDKAEPPMRGSWSLFDSVSGPAAVPTLSAKHQLAVLYTVQGRTAEAESLFVAALDGLRRAPTGDKEVLQTMNDLALLYTDSRRFASAESLYKIVLPAQRRKVGAEDRTTLAVLANYAWTLDGAEKYAEAESLAVLALALRRKVLGPEHPETMQSVNNLAVLYVRTGRYALAEPLYLEDLATSRRLLGEEHPEVLVSMTNLGRLYNRQKKFADAEPMLRKALASTRKMLPHAYIGTGITLLAHSEALVGLGRPREAEPELVEAYGILRAATAADDPGVQRCVQTLVDVYERTGRAAMAASWKQKLTAGG